MSKLDDILSYIELFFCDYYALAKNFRPKVILEVTVFSWGFLCFDQSDSFCKFFATILYHRKKKRDVR